MDINTYRQQLDKAKQDYLNQAKAATESSNQAAGFGQSLTDAIKQRDDTYKTVNNDVNTARANYYNSSEQVLPQLFTQYKNDPLYALQALGHENTIRNIAYRNADDIRNQKQGSIADFINAFNQSAQTEAQKQQNLANMLKEAYGIADNEYSRAYAEDQAKKAAKAQAAYLASLNGGGGGNGLPTNTRIPVGQKDATGKTIAGYDANGNPVYQEDLNAMNGPKQPNMIQQFAEVFNPEANKAVYREKIKPLIPAPLQGAFLGSPIVKNSLSNSLNNAYNVFKGIGGLFG